MLRKTIPFTAAKLAVKADGSGAGQIEGYASVFGGVDAYGDTIIRGAYAETIPEFVVRGALHHEHDTRLRLGTISGAKEDDRGLLITADFHSDPEAQRIRTQIVERLDRGKFMGLSIGYEALDYEYRAPRDGEAPPPWGDKIRVLKRIKLYEVSVVSVPADADAEVIAAKARPFDSHFQDVRVAVQEWLQRVKSGSDMRAEKGREPLTAERRAALEAMSGSLRLTADEMDALLVPPPPAERLVIGAELRRRRYAAAGLNLERPA